MSCVRFEPEGDVEAQLEQGGGTKGACDWEQDEEQRSDEDGDQLLQAEDDDDDELDDGEDLDKDHLPDLEGGFQGGTDCNGRYNDVDVNHGQFEELELHPDFIAEVTRTWDALLNAADSWEALGEAIYEALFEAAPSMQSLFKTPQAVQVMRFIGGLNQIIRDLANPTALKVLVETLAFQHLNVEVTIPRVVVFRDALVELIAMELGASATQMALRGWSTIFNYIGGAVIYVRVKFTDRLKILSSSWATANKTHDQENSSESAGVSAEERRQSGESLIHPASEGGKRGKTTGSVVPDAGDSDGNFRNVVPTSYREMFAFNAAVMGFGTHAWMNEVLQSFDAIVQNVNNLHRLREECDVLSLRMAKHSMDIDLSAYRAVMLASLRSMVPASWNSEHEMAWNWLWDNVERMLKSNLGKPRRLERYLEMLWGSLDDGGRAYLRQEAYATFFGANPAGQNFFKQSATRLHFIADKVIAITLEIFKDPVKTVNDLSAIGLRHVGYGIPAELFNPFVTSWARTVSKMFDFEDAVEAFRWSMDLISRILSRVVTESSTIVMKAINQDSGKGLRNAVQCAPRGKRAMWMLNIQVGTQSISPFMWAVETGRLDAARAIIVDLLTIRGDRERYYYGVDSLFDRHPDVIRSLCIDAPTLLPVLLDGLVWRSRTTEEGMRRVNYYVQHLLLDSDGCFAKAIEWITDTSDPKIVCHPVMAIVTDIVWSRIGFRAFLMKKSFLVLTLVVFLLGTAGTKHFRADSQVGRTIVFVCRCFIYVFSLGWWLRHHAKSISLDIRSRDFEQVGGVPVPAYLVDPQQLATFLLTVCMLVMLWLEPILHCLPHSNGNFPGSGFLTDACPQAEGTHFAYSAVSVVAVFLYFALAMDLTVFSTRLSALVLACYRILAEVGTFLVGLCFAIVAFGSAACAFDQGNEDFSGFHIAALSLMRISFGMYRVERFEALQDEPGLMMIVVLYLAVALVILFNLLIAQFNCSYHSTYKDMLGYARLRQGRVIVEAVRNISDVRWQKFVESLQFDKRCEFGEGDVGLPGAIQMLEPASLHPTDEEMIHRFGGPTSPDAQWPQEKDPGDEQEDSFARLERTVGKAMKRVGSGRGASAGKRTTFKSSAMSGLTSSGFGSSGDKTE